MAWSAALGDPSARGRRDLLALCGLAVPLAALGLGGCSTPPAPATLPSLLSDADYPPPAEPPPDVASLTAMSPAMLEFIEAQPWVEAPSRDLRRELVHALYRPREPGRRGLRLEYESTRTRTAAEAFEAGAGNCLSLVLMTAAFARHLGLPVSFQAVQVSASYSRSGTLTLINGHVNLVMGPRPARSTLDRPDPNRLVVDFLSPREIREQHSLPLSEATIHAMFFNNRAAELLGAGDVSAAYWHVREALALDPGFLHAANTLGVVHRRAGLADAAERVFRHVLAQEPDAVPALSNLLGLLQQQGRAHEAEAMASRLARLQPVAPFQWLAAGRDALAMGDAAAAVELLERELRLQPEHPEVHAAMAAARLRLGQLARARRHLALAAEFATTPSDQRRYLAKLSPLSPLSPPGMAGRPAP